MAVVRNGFLWTCRTVFVNQYDDIDPPNDVGDRTACEWLQFKISGTSLSYVDSGRVLDSSASNPIFYYYPSVMVNAFGDVVMGFTGSGNNVYPSAYFAGKLAYDTSSTAFQTAYSLNAGTGPNEAGSNSPQRWGDYSYTTLDPNDGLSFWTIQQYGKGSSTHWQLHIGKIKPY
jgi:hypothetical protein